MLGQYYFGLESGSDDEDRTPVRLVTSLLDSVGFIQKNVAQARL